MDDKYEEYNYKQDNLVNSGHSGKHRSKKEQELHTNRPDTSGHTRKLTQKFQNTEKNRKDSN